MTEANCQQYFILERISCKRASTENVMLFKEVLVFCDLIHRGSKYVKIVHWALPTPGTLVAESSYFITGKTHPSVKSELFHKCTVSHLLY